MTDGAGERCPSTAVADTVSKESLRSRKGAAESMVLHFSMSTMAEEVNLRERGWRASNEATDDGGEALTVDGIQRTRGMRQEMEGIYGRRELCAAPPSGERALDGRICHAWTRSRRAS